MPDEALITQIEDLLSEVVALGGQSEFSEIVPNLAVIDADPTGLAGFIIISDDRDGDNILAKKVGSVIYTDGDLVNVFFLEGTEPIAFQQGSQSANSQSIWEIIDGTTTDIRYTKGNVAIGTPTPSAMLHVQGGTADLPSLTGDGLVIQDAPNITNLWIVAGSTALASRINFADPDDENIGQISYNHTLNSMSFTANNSLSMTINSSANVGIGTVLPDGTMHVHTASAGAVTADSSADDLVVENSSSGGISILTPDADVSILYLGGVTDNTSGQVSFSNATDDMFIGSLKAGGRVRLRSGNNIDALTLASDQDVGIGILIPTAQLHIDQSDDSAAQPVILLDQADVDEPFTKFIGTAAAATLTNSIVDDGDVTTATLVGWVKIEIDDIGNQVTDGDYFQPFYSLA